MSAFRPFQTSAGKSESDPLRTLEIKLTLRDRRKGARYDYPKANT
jgi:hypothetical protein